MAEKFERKRVKCRGMKDAKAVQVVERTYVKINTIHRIYINIQLL